MPRRGGVPKREIIPDPIYNDEMVTRFINKLMLDGKKSLAEKIFYDSFEIIREKTGNDPLELFHQALKNVMPILEVRPRRVGGATYQVPMEVRPERRMSLAFRWIIQSARARKDKSMAIRLANELMAAANGEGSAIKKKDDMHRMAEANRAFAHFRF